MAKPVLQLCVAVSVLVITGCSTRENPGNEFAFFGGGRVNVGGPNQMLDARIERYDGAALIYLITPKVIDKSAITPGTEDDTGKPESGIIKIKLESLENDIDTSAGLASALRDAFALANKAGPTHRDAVQEHLVLASEQSCNYYKDYLRRLDSYKSFFLGTLTTIFGGASAIVSGEAAARLLGGTAGITSGVSAEFDQAFFKNVAIRVITPAIDLRRKERLKEIRKKRTKNGQPVETKDYNVQEAIADAIKYHNECTLNAGLEEAAESIQTVDHPGLIMAVKVAKAVKKSRAALDLAVLTPAKARVEKIRKELLEKIDTAGQAKEHNKQAQKALLAAETKHTAVLGTAIKAANKAIGEALEADEKAKTALMVAQEKLRIAKVPATNTAKSELERLTKAVKAATAKEQQAAKKLAEEEAKKAAVKKILDDALDDAKDYAKKVAKAFDDAKRKLAGVEDRFKVAKTFN